jgi:hypothetical protein
MHTPHSKEEAAMVCLETSARLHLQPRGLIRLTDALGTTVTTLSGAVWITQHQDRRDIVIEAGESFTLDRNGLSLIHALVTSAEVAITEPKTGEREPAAAATETAPDQQAA